MLKTFEYRLLCGLGILSILLLAVNIGLYSGNRSIQASVNARTQYIQQTEPVRALYQDIVKALAQEAIKNKDEQVRALLSQEGFTINQSQPDTAAASPSPSRGKP